MCFKSIDCSGDIVKVKDDKYFDDRTCCVGTNNGLSFSTGGICTVTECRGKLIIYTLPVKKNRTPDKIAHVYVYGTEY